MISRIGACFQRVENRALQVGVILVEIDKALKGRFFGVGGR